MADLNTMKQDLHKQRFAAALASKGTSGDPIYHTALKLCKTHNLNGDLLEFGAGTGQLIGQLFDSDYRGHLTGADILPRPETLPTSVEWIQADLNYPLQIPANSFDVIISTEVIEHLENPRAVFREFFRLLRDHGTLLVTTPNQESIRSLLALVFGGHFVAFRDVSYPAHITALVRMDFERICDETGFTRPSFYYTDAGGIPKFPHIRWQQASFGLMKGRLFSDNIVMVSKKQSESSSVSSE